RRGELAAERGDGLVEGRAERIRRQRREDRDRRARRDDRRALSMASGADSLCKLRGLAIDRRHERCVLTKRFLGFPTPLLNLERACAPPDCHGACPHFLYCEVMLGEAEFRYSLVSATEIDERLAPIVMTPAIGRVVLGRACRHDEGL